MASVQTRPLRYVPISSPALDHDSTSEHRALTGHLLSGIPTPTPAPALLPTHSSADKNMAAVAAPRDLYGICKKTLGKSEGMVASAGRRRKRRKDRHSKINTAQGPRDRRMRLSLDVARRFFDLQDMLGFDKASGTVEWLLSKSRSAIKDLTGCSSPTPVHSTDAADQAKGESTSSSECEVISASTNDKPTAGETRDAAAQEVNTLPRVKRAAARPPRKPAANPALARETRLMARARARDRTWEKKMWCRALHAVSPAVQPLSWNPLQIAGAKPGVHGVKSSPQTAAEAEQVNSYLPGRYRTSVQDQNPEAYPPPVCTGGSDQISISDYADNIAHEGAATAGFAQEQWNVQLSGNFEDPRVLLLGDDQHQARHWGPFNSPSI